MYENQILRPACKINAVPKTNWNCLIILAHWSSRGLVQTLWSKVLSLSIKAPLKESTFRWISSENITGYPGSSKFFHTAFHKQKWEATFWSCSQVPNLWCSAPAPGCQTPVPDSEVTPCFSWWHMKCKNNWDISPPFTTLNPERQRGRKMDPRFTAGCSSSKLLLRKGQSWLSPIL